jgi:hypothetical protein
MVNGVKQASTGGDAARLTALTALGQHHARRPRPGVGAARSSLRPLRR